MIIAYIHTKTLPIWGFKILNCNIFFFFFWGGGGGGGGVQEK